MSPDYHDLLRLLHVAARALPGLNGEIGAAQDHQLICGSPDNAARVCALHRYWEQSHPEAGPHYWSARSWSLLIWQPIYFSLLAVHLGGRAPCLAHMGQSVIAGSVHGFRLPPHCPYGGDLRALIACASDQLQDFVETQLDEFNAVAVIYPKMARLLVADCVRAALLLAQRHEPVTDDVLLEAERHWLDALALPGGSALVPLELDDGRHCLAMGRKVCCQHFRRADGELCASCPKLARDERLKRLREAASC
ncbi:siderophore ferric iron reductase [Stutzerimonas xanthomarina]|uniref:Siderophore ferric iron reductase, AHA_1954 family n=2 Tax=Stutzerimonas xanthomarina TaxID=271420 RepID=A0A1M5PPJ9_9GAMM|nr:siderophore ferric iron reductase [Stutzerimonas xanthomarina]MCP9338231.1 siderophore ferric iron reductase [Stutzerimonas xanthomarina]SEH72589.1 siderophore ferric iron reductase, AHA_1954 family [Stutzerimonas xanthomarina]SHH03765.1 siderophore ferric iron reductase, AHA_1954 family [Stutzerimonas xanthomarina DSM 18231]